MRELEIIIQDDVFVTSYTSVVDTTFILCHKGVCFPYDQWTDFTFPILEEWKYDLFKIRNLSNISTNLYFHDGPYWLEVYKDNKMGLQIECINDRKERYSALTICCNYYEFLECIYETMKSFIKILYSNGMHIGDFEPIYQQSIISKNEIEGVLKDRK